MTTTTNKLSILIAKFSLFLCPFVFLQFTKNFDFENTKLIFLGFASVVLLSIKIWSIIKNDSTAKLNNYFVILFLFVASAALSSIFSGNFYLTFWGDDHIPNGSLASFLIVFIFVFAIFQTIQNFKDVTSILRTLCWGGACLGIYTIIQHFGLDPNSWNDYEEYRERAFGTIGQTVALGTYMGAISLLNLIFVFGDDKKLSKTHFIFWIISVLAVYYSGSRAPIFALNVMAIGIFLFLYWRANTKDKKATLATISKIVISMVFIFAVNFFEKSNAAFKKSTATQISLGTKIRIEWWKSAFHIFKQNPIIGVGPENVDVHYKKIRPVAHNYFETWRTRLSKVHNEPLHILVTQGILGFLLYAVLIGYFLLHIFKNGLSSENKTTHVVLLSTFVFIFGCNLAAFNMVNSQYLFFLLPVLYFVISAQSKELVQKPNWLNQRLMHGLSLGLISMFFIFILSLSYKYTMKLYSISLYQRSETAFDRNDYSSTNLYLTKALQVHPDDFRFYCRQAEYTTKLFKNQVDLSQLKTGKMTTEHNLIVTSILKDIDRCLALGANDTFSFESVSYIYFLLRELDEKYLQMSFDMLDRSLEMHPNNPLIDLMKAHFYFTLDEHQKALPHIEKALSLKINYLEPYIQLLAIYYKTGEISKAGPLFDRLINLEDDQFNAVEFRESLTQDLGRLEQLVKNFKDTVSEQKIVLLKNKLLK